MMKRVAVRSARIVRRPLRRPGYTKTPSNDTKEAKDVVEGFSLPSSSSKNDPLPANVTKGEGIESTVKPPSTNPFPSLTQATKDIDLSARLRSFSNNFSVIGALWCSLSMAALSMAPIDDVYKDTERIENAGCTEGSAVIVRRRTTIMIPKHMPAPRKAPGERRRTPVLVKYFGLNESLLEDIYMALWSASFFASAIGLGLSTVVAGIVASTAPGYIKIFVRRHSNIILAIPVFQAFSGAFAFAGLTVGLDEARGEPVSYIGYIGTIGGTAIIGKATFDVLKGYKAYRAAGKIISTPKQP
jgi:hypothetical protein